jgi:hypothetical protein
MLPIAATAASKHVSTGRFPSSLTSRDYFQDGSPRIPTFLLGELYLHLIVNGCASYKDDSAVF